VHNMIAFLYTIAILCMIFIPVGAAIWLRRRFQARWILFAIGSLTFFGSQVVHIPLNNLLTDLGVLPANDFSGDVPLLQTALVLGLTAGLCEELARALGYWLLKRTRRLEEGIMLGIGHGGFEAMVIGGVFTAASLSALLPMLGTDLSTLNLSPEQLSAVELQISTLLGSPSLSFAPLLERLLAMTLHVSLSVMVLKAFQTRKPLWVVAAIVYHMVVDAIAVYIGVNSTGTVQGVWFSIAILAATVVPGAVLLVIEWRKGHQDVAPRHHGRDLTAFAASFRKEMVQLWRTKRFLVVMAVFILFGLTSPLLAYFTPQMLGMIEGAEMFSDLIPTPTAADAMAQYVKNLSQFGFILAVALGMTAVAAEKESGTAALIMSKPMPRWAFVTSKFAAQALVYAAGFMIACLGAIFYTWLLFGVAAVGEFVTASLLMLLWLLVFVAAALLGSVIGGTTAAAAGYGFGLSILWLLTGVIPNYGQLFPGGLITWASVIGQGLSPEPPPTGFLNFGAVALAVVLIVLQLLLAIGLFEPQEL